PTHAHADVVVVLRPRPLPPPRWPGTPVQRLPVPPVDHPQAVDVARPVRHGRLRGVRAVHHLVPGRHRHHGRSGSRRRGGCPVITSVTELVASHPLLAGLPPDVVLPIAGCARNVSI